MLFSSITAILTDGPWSIYWPKWKHCFQNTGFKFKIVSYLWGPTHSLKFSFNSCGKRIIFPRIQVLHLFLCLPKAEILCFCKVKNTSTDLQGAVITYCSQNGSEIFSQHQTLVPTSVFIERFLLVPKASSLMGCYICLTTLDATRLRSLLISTGVQAHGKQAPLVARIQTYKHRLLVTFRT